jgi:hypothetical protein
MCCPRCLFLYTFKKRLATFPSPSRMSLTKLSLSGDNLIIVTSRLGTGKSLTFFYSVSVFPSLFSEVLGRTNDMVAPLPPFLLAFYMTRGPKKTKTFKDYRLHCRGNILEEPSIFFLSCIWLQTPVLSATNSRYVPLPSSPRSS